MTHPSSLVWFRFHAGDLGALTWLGFRVHLARCAECRGRFESELAERASFEGAGPAPRAPLVLRLAMPALVAVACLVVWQVSVRRPRGEMVAMNDEPETFRPKGGAVFDVLVMRNGEQAPLGAQCREGDALQARYSGGALAGETGGAQLLVVGVDPHGAARVLFPLDGPTSMAITPGPSLVPNSWVLDGEPGRERFVAFFSSATIRAEDALRAARQDNPQLAGATIKVSECVKPAR